MNPLATPTVLPPAPMSACLVPSKTPARIEQTQPFAGDEKNIKTQSQLHAFNGRRLAISGAQTVLRNMCARRSDLLEPKEHQRAAVVKAHSRNLAQSCTAVRPMGVFFSVATAVGQVCWQQKVEPKRAMLYTVGTGLLCALPFAAAEYRTTPEYRVRTRRNQVFEQFCNHEQDARKRELDLLMLQLKFNFIRSKLDPMEAPLKLDQENLSELIEQYKKRQTTLQRENHLIRSSVEAEYALRDAKTEVQQSEKNLKEAQKARDNIRRQFNAISSRDATRAARKMVLRQELTSLETQLSQYQIALDQARQKASSAQAAANRTFELLTEKDIALIAKQICPLILLQDYQKQTRELQQHEQKGNIFRRQLEQAGADDIVINGPYQEIKPKEGESEVDKPEELPEVPKLAPGKDRGEARKLLARLPDVITTAPASS